MLGPQRAAFQPMHRTGFLAHSRFQDGAAPPLRVAVGLSRCGIMRQSLVIFLPIPPRAEKLAAARPPVHGPAPQPVTPSRKPGLLDAPGAGPYVFSMAKEGRSGPFHKEATTAMAAAWGGLRGPRTRLAEREAVFAVLEKHGLVVTSRGGRSPSAPKWEIIL